MPTEELTFEYEVDGQWYSSVDVRTDDVYTPDGDPIGSVSDFRVVTKEGEPPYPPSEAENQCNGRTQRDTACQLTYNWGRVKPVSVNPGRCRYHRNQPISDAQEPDTDPDPGQTPYPDGTPHSLPGTIDASHFDEGEDAYHDTTAERKDDPPSNFRTDTSVDISNPDETNATGDGAIEWIDEGEWWEYTVEIPAGVYEISLFVASEWDSELAVWIDGTLIGVVSRNTGGWQNWQEAVVGQFTVDGPGTHVIRVEATKGALNWDRFTVRKPTQSDGGYGNEGYGGSGYGE